MSVVHLLFIRRRLRDRHLCCDTVLSPCLEEQRTNNTRCSTGVRDKSLIAFFTSISVKLVRVNSENLSLFPQTLTNIYKYNDLFC